MAKAHRNSLKPDYKLHWYRVKTILGQGGFGITYLAHDFNLDEDVAIKEYLPIEMAVRENDYSVHPVSENHSKNYNWGLTRFIEEARTLSKFKHPNIVRVRNVFEDNNTAYMVMEYERGQSLGDILKTRKTLEEAELLKILIPIIGGLELVHKAGFIHRDIKPDNIFIREDQSPVLLDFGSARQALGGVTKTLTSLVSPGYAPFEQYYSKSDEQGPWTDIYGLAATMYRAIVGRAPQDAVDRSKAILQTNRDVFVLLQEIAKGQYSERFLRAIDHGLNFKQAERPQTVAEWQREFEIPTEQPAALSESRIATRVATENRLPTKDAKLALASEQGAHVDERRSDNDSDTGQKAAPELKTGGAFKKTLLVLVIAAATLYSQPQLWRPFYEQWFPSATPQDPRLAKMQADLDKIEQKKKATEAATRRAKEEARLQAELDKKKGELAEAEQQQQAIEHAAQQRLQDERARKEKIQKLFSLAEADIAERRLTSPEGSNAHEKYLAVLKLVPGNKAAAAGIENIIKVYLGLFEAELAKQEFAKATIYLDRVRAIHGDAPQLIPAEQQLAQAKKKQKLAQAKLEKDLQEKARLEQQARLKSQREEQVRAWTGEMLDVPGGRFQMGSNDGDETPVHNVSIKAFRLGKHEITQGQWKALMHESPSHFAACGDNCPVEKVSWDEVQGFIQKLNTKTGGNYRLPTEAEWEYACRSGGRAEKFCGSNDPQRLSWYSDNSHSKTHPVGQKQANGLGLHDMSGNVWEWTADCWNASYQAAPANGDAWTNGVCSRRVLRGGSWYNSAASLRSAYRGSRSRASRDNSFGFRLAQD